jgi:hypothetical protein
MLHPGIYIINISVTWNTLLLIHEHVIYFNIFLTIKYLIYGFGMVTCTISPLSRFTAHLLPVYSATYKLTSGGILSMT